MSTDAAPVDPAEGPLLCVETPEALASLASRIATCDLVALDIEANSMHAYRERPCVVQLTTPRESAIVDAIAVEDLGALGDALDREDVEVVFHGGDYDVALLARDQGFVFHRVFDTMIAATLLGEEK
ncbi:MAG: ribonuclease D, partial [Planctomycetota bacterium]